MFATDTTCRLSENKLRRQNGKISKRDQASRGPLRLLHKVLAIYEIQAATELSGQPNNPRSHRVTFPPACLHATLQQWQREDKERILGERCPAALLQRRSHDRTDPD